MATKIAVGEFVYNGKPAVMHAMLSIEGVFNLIITEENGVTHTLYCPSDVPMMRLESIIGWSVISRYPGVSGIGS